MRARGEDVRRGDLLLPAGLVIHRQLLSGRANRVLILVPENLQHQWLVEMRRRFNLDVALFDAEVGEPVEVVIVGPDGERTVVVIPAER